MLRPNTVAETGSWSVATARPSTSAENVGCVLYDFVRSSVRVARSCLILHTHSFVVGGIERSKQWTEVKVARVLAHAEGADVPVESEHQDTQDQHLLKPRPNTH